MTAIKFAILVTALGSALAASPAIARERAIVLSAGAASSLGDPAHRQKLDQIIARQKALGSSDPRIHVRDGVCSDGMPTCYDGPSNTITIAGDPTKYHYKTVPEPGQPAVFPYSWDRALYREVQKAFLWWVEEKREGVDTRAYDQENILPKENDHFWRLRREPYRLCGHSLSECLELRPQ